MSLISSLYTGQTGLESSTTDLSVIGDNIANASTTGFKASRANFSNAMAQQMIGSGGATSQVGLGSQLMNVQKILTQGALSNTGIATDLALDGNGFFVVKGLNNGSLGQFYTRAGQVSMDKAGFLANPEGLLVQGFPADATGALSPTPGNLQLGSSISPALATATITVKANLDSASKVPLAFDPTSLTTMAATSNFAVTTTVYDSIGAQHQVDVYFRKTTDATTTTGAVWESHAMTDGAGVTAGVAGTPVEIQTTTGITFGLNGELVSPGAVAPAPVFNPLGATQAQAIAVNIGDDTTAGGTGLNGLTQTAMQSQTKSVMQSGHGSGVLSSITIDKTGQIQGAFSNGQSRVVGQVAVALLDAPDQMERASGNLFVETTASGSATLGKAGLGGRGGTVAGALENSNVDLSTEFIKMIAAQRDYQANAKTVTTADALLAELMNLKR